MLTWWAKLLEGILSASIKVSIKEPEKVTGSRINVFCRFFLFFVSCWPLLQLLINSISDSVTLYLLHFLLVHVYLVFYLFIRNKIEKPSMNLNIQLLTVKPITDLHSFFISLRAFEHVDNISKWALLSLFFKSCGSNLWAIRLS